jgi:hypothetical protein
MPDCPCIKCADHPDLLPRILSAVFRSPQINELLNIFSADVMAAA